eukprot:3867073-Prymnesium_polylepis.1
MHTHSRKAPVGLGGDGVATRGVLLSKLREHPLGEMGDADWVVKNTFVYHMISHASGRYSHARPRRPTAHG